MVKTIAVLFLSFAGVTCAQDRKVNNEPQPDAARKRLKSVTWDLASHKLIWIVENGKLEGREFVPTSSDRYEISPDEAQMQFANEKRGFSETEAASLHKLLDTLAIYCAESVVWWDQGQGNEVKPKTVDDRKSETVENRKPADSEALRWAVARTLK
jgi:hypothetical protein